MMVIETDFGVGQKVFFLDDNKVVRGTITEIVITANTMRTQADYTVVKDDTFLDRKETKHFKTIQERDHKQVKAEIFATKQDLVNSL